MDLHLFLVIMHVAGTILGVGGATLAEVFYLVTLRTDKISAGERRLLHANYAMIRIGLALVIISGVALMWWWVYLGGSDWPLLSPKIWMKDIMVGVILINAILLARRWIPFWLGASLSFTSWWAATILGLWQRIPYSFMEMMIAYIIAIFVVAIILEVIKRIVLRF